jgi:hypothetical protein
MLVGPISWFVLMCYAVLFGILRKMNYNGHFELKFIPIYPLAAAFILLDVLFNLIIGSFVFLERPREFLFTDRLKRHKAGPDGDYKEFAIYICKIMNRYDPGHC